MITFIKDSLNMVYKMMEIVPMNLKQNKVSGNIIKMNFYNFLQITLNSYF